MLIVITVHENVKEFKKSFCNFASQGINNKEQKMYFYGDILIGLLKLANII